MGRLSSSRVPSEPVVPLATASPVCGSLMITLAPATIGDPGDSNVISSSASITTLNETLRWTRPTLAPFALARLFSLVPHLLPVVTIIPVVTICARAFPVACLSRRSDHAILLAFHGNLYHDSAPTALH